MSEIVIKTGLVICIGKKETIEFGPIDTGRCIS